jgi:uncharacterized protein YbcI
MNPGTGGPILQDPERERGGRGQPGPDDPGPPDEVARPTSAEVADAICRDILAIHLDSYGRAAGKAQAHVLDDTVIVVLDELELLPNEEFLIEKGRHDAVVNLRSAYQKAIESTFRAAVERATGRRVVGFASHIQLEEQWFAVEIFRLEHH